MTACFAQRQITLLKILNFHLNRGACFSPAILHFLKWAPDVYPNWQSSYKLAKVQANALDHAQRLIGLIQSV